MNECLVTTLKGVVNDDNLRKLGDIIAEKRSGFVNTVDSCYMQFLSPDTLTVEILNDGQFCLNQSGTPDPSAGKSKVLSVGNRSVWVTSGTKFRVMPKYNLTGFTSANTNINLDDFSHVPNLKILNVATSTEIHGSLAVLSNLTNLENITLGGVSTSSWLQLHDTIEVLSNLKNLLIFSCQKSYIYGDITIAFGSNTKINQIAIADTNVTGSIESFVDAQIAAGRTEGSVLLPYLKSTKLTFEGVPVKQNENVPASSGANSISWVSDGTVTFV